MAETVKDKLHKSGKTQVWLIKELAKRDVVVQPPEMSNIINGLYTTPKSRRVLAECELILESVIEDE